MKDQIIAILNHTPEISDWTLDIAHKRKQELYLIFNEVESQRDIDTISYYPTVYINQEQDGQKMTGTATCTILPNTDESDIKKQIAEAVLAAGFAMNPYHSIAEKAEPAGDYQACDQRIADDQGTLIDDVRKTIIHTIESESEIRMSSAEIMLTLNNHQFITSKGLAHTSQSTDILFELVLLAGPKENEVETFTLREERLLDIMDIEGLIQRYAQYTRDNLTATLPESGKYTVIFTEDALDAFFDYYTYQVSAENLFNQSSRFEVGQEVVSNPKADLLTLSFDPGLRGGTRTGNYDGYGLPLKKFTAIDKGVFVTPQANNRYAEYLGLEPNGAATNVVVEPGPLSYKEMLEDNVFIFSRFSSFEPDIISGAFSGELRNGFHYKNGEFHPVKGGSVTGVLDSAMQEVRFSKETTHRGFYSGPQYIKLRNVDVTG